MELRSRGMKQRMDESQQNPVFSPSAENGVLTPASRDLLVTGRRAVLYLRVSDGCPGLAAAHFLKKISKDQ